MFSARDQHVLYKTVFSARDLHVLTFFARCAPFCNSFQQIARVCPKSKTALLARDQPVLSLSHCADQLLAIFSKMHEFVQNSVSRPRSAGFVILTLGTPLLIVFSKVHEFVQSSVFSPKSARFNIFALC